MLEYQGGIVTRSGF